MEKNKTKAILKRYFPEIEQFRDMQEECIDSILSGQNTLCLMPTGSGKSLIYQVAGLRLGKATLVISPLVALMQQQNMRLRKRELITLFLHGALSGNEQFAMLRKLFNIEKPDFIFTTPERLTFDGYFEYIVRRDREKIGLIVIDEAHCVSQWGHSFRPLYKMIPHFLDNVFGSNSWPPILCLTATLNPKDQEEICLDFRIKGKNVFKSKFLLRDNLKLKFEVLSDERSKKERLKELLVRHKNEKAIIYTHRKKSKQYGTRAFAEEFNANGFECEYFDADMEDRHKIEVLERFEKGAIKTIFATSAFGMGIDIPDIRVIIHYLVPESIEQYYQEVGRAGRDGKEAMGYLLYSQTNIRIRKDLIKNSVPDKTNLLEAFNKKFNNGDENKTAPLNFWLDIAEEQYELTSFYYFQKLDVIKVVGKGVGKINCFKCIDSSMEADFNRYSNVSKIGSIIAISNKTGRSVQIIMDNLFNWYTNGGVRLIAAPIKVIFFKSEKEIAEGKINQICGELEERRAVRFKKFDEFVQMIESEEKPEIGICRYLGIEEGKEIF